MDYDVKGIRFKEDDLQTISVSDLNAGSISRSHIFFLLQGSSKAILLLRAGDYIEQSFINKYIEKGVMHLWQLEIAKLTDINKYKDLLEKLSHSQNSGNQLEVKDQILRAVTSDFYISDEKTFLSFVIACFDTFYLYPVHVINQYQEVSMTLYSRALLTSSVSVLASLVNGYLDYYYMRDFYNVCFIMDYSLVEYSSYHFTTAMACEAERKEPGTGLLLLKQMNRSAGEEQLFLNHPIISYEYALEYQDQFKYPEIQNFIKFHHEKKDGSGFPEGLCYSVLSDAETILSFCDNLIPFSEHFFACGDGQLILKEYLKELNFLKKGYLLPITKIKSRWGFTFEHYSQNMNETIEIVEMDEVVVNE